jgi:nicotinamidase-related amidase
VTAGVVDFEDHCWRDVVSPEILRVYEPYRRKTGVKGKPGLLAVDLFASAFPDGPGTLADAVKINPRSCGPHAWAAKPVLDRLLRMVRDAGHPVVYSAADVGERAGQPRPRATLRQTPEDEGNSRSAADFAIHADFAPAPGDAIVPKQRASAFFGTGLAELLAGQGVKTLIVCGQSTSGCVRASTVDAYSHGFHVVVVEDAVFDRSLLSHKVSLFDLHHKYADVMALSELAGVLS